MAPLWFGLISVSCLATDVGKTDPGSRSASSPGGTDEASPGEIVITGGRPGDAPVPSETEFDESEMAAQGVDTIEALLSRFQPFIDPNGDEPLILINGKPAGFDRSILSYPPEALNRIAVLKPEAAGLYGAKPGRRVINLILKNRFASTDLDAATDFSGAWGQYGGAIGVMRAAVSGATRWNAQARVSHQRALPRRSRDTSPSVASLDSLGYVGGLDGGEIDPALSLMAGETVTVAAIPAEADRRLSLADFAATANIPDPVDPGGFETLQPSTRGISLGFGIAHPVGGFSTSLNVNASRNDVHGSSGLPIVSLLVPAESPWSPFGKPVAIHRALAGSRSLRYGNRSQSLSGSLTLNGRLFGMQSSMSVSASRYDGWDTRETGIDGARLQHAIDARDPTIDPFGTLDEGLLQVRRGRSHANNIAANLNLQKNAGSLPAGPIAWSISANGGRAESVAAQYGADAAPARYRSTNAQADGQISVTLPMSRRGSKFAALRDLSVGLTAATQKRSGSAAQTSFGGSVSWAPFEPIQLGGAFTHAELAASAGRSDAPIVTTVTRVFDYARHQITEVNWTSGGTPPLGRGSQQSLSLSMMLRPLGRQALTLNIGYRRLVTHGGATGFPELTPTVEAAFPDRVTRDRDGRLVAVDARPITIDHEESSDLGSSLTLHLGGKRLDGAVAGPARIAADPVQLDLSLSHQMLLTSRILIRRGLPTIDRQDFDSGNSRTALTMNLAIGKRAFGGTLGTSWSSPTHVTSSEGEFRVVPPLLFNLAAFVNVNQLFKCLRNQPLTKGLKLSLNVHNLLDGYRRIALADGSTPVGYGRHDVAPLGRTATVTIRKPF